MQKVSNEQYQPDTRGIKSARDTPHSIPLDEKRSTENRGSNGTVASVTSATLECVAEKRVLYLTTIGRRTGLPREIEIWFVVRYERFYLFAETGETAGWVKNIRRNPKVTVRIGEWRIDATASVLDRHSDRELWDQVAAIADRKYGWGDGLPVEITPLPSRPDHSDPRSCCRDQC